MIFSVSERQTYKRCKRKWGLQSENREALEPVREAQALMMGSLVQSALSDWTEGKTTDAQSTLIAHARDYMVRVEADYLQRTGEMLPDEASDPLYEGIDLAREMVELYTTFHPTPLPSPYRAVRTEQRALCPIPTTEHWECNVCHYLPTPEDFNWHLPHDGIHRCPECSLTEVQWQPHFLRGTLDTLVQDQNGRFLPLERKTYKQRPRKDKLQNDDQMLAYCWLLVQLLGWDKYGGGVLYDGLWKRLPDKKHPIEDLFYRERFIRPREEIEEFGRLLAVEAMEMARDMQRPLEDLTINRRWEGCYDCGVARICEAMSRGEDVEYIRDTYYRRRRDNSGDVTDVTAEDDAND